MPKILVIRFSSIGDIVLTTPVLRCLKQQLPDAEIHFCTKKVYQICIQHNPYVEKIHVLENDLKVLVAELQAEQFDYIIDLHNNLRTKIIKWKLGVKKSYSFNKLNLQKWLLVKFKIKMLPLTHVVQRYLDTVSPLGVFDDGAGLDFPIPQSEVVSKDELPLVFRVGYAAFVIGAAHATKRMTEEKIIEFAKAINYPVVLLGGKEDKILGDKVHKILYDLDIPVQNLCGKYNLLQSASLLMPANLVVTNDTGLMHIAAALKKKIYVAWGNTVPAFGMYPYKSEFVSIENNTLPCRPCSKIGFEKCPQGHFKCMKELVFVRGES